VKDKQPILVYRDGSVYRSTMWKCIYL